MKSCSCRQVAEAEALGDMLVKIVEALDREDPAQAMALASETLAELRRTLVVH